MASQKHPIDRTSFVIQWLRLHTPSAEDLGSTPGQGMDRGAWWAAEGRKELDMTE